MLIVLLTAGVMIQSGTAATTVSLTGSCYSNVLNSTSNTIYFKLVNSGNSAAVNLNVFPSMNGARVINHNIYFQSIKPGNTSMAFHLNKFSIPGGYVGVINIKYNQGTSTVFSLFPCFYYIGRQSNVKVSILNTSIRNARKNFENINVSVLNFGTDTIKVIIKPFSPVNFNITPKSQSITVGPGEKVNSSFSVHMTSTADFINASFPIGFYAEYVKDGIHYSTRPYALLFHNVSHTKNQNIVIYILLTVGAVVVSMIIISIIVNFKKNRKHGG